MLILPIKIFRYLIYELFGSFNGFFIYFLHLFICLFNTYIITHTVQVPASLGKLGCIVNLAGNMGLEHGPDVPQSERDALVAFFHATRVSLSDTYMHDACSRLMSSGC
jgi:hypothetical protein